MAPTGTAEAGVDRRTLANVTRAAANARANRARAARTRGRRTRSRAMDGAARSAKRDCDRKSKHFASMLRGVPIEAISIRLEMATNRWFPARGSARRACASHVAARKDDDMALCSRRSLVATREGEARCSKEGSSPAQSTINDKGPRPDAPWLPEDG